jgi:transcription elongation factor Elf1
MSNTLEHQRYLRQESAKADSLQTIFDVQGIIRRKPKPLKRRPLDIQETVNCPFCLYEGQLRLFLISTKKGLSIREAKCPECKNTMYMDTLTAERTITEYALWVFQYAKSGFFKKIPFQTWAMRLKILGVSQDFWDAYKRYRGDNDEE